MLVATEERLVVRSTPERHHRDYQRQNGREDAHEGYHPEQWELRREDQDKTQHPEDPEQPGQVLHELPARFRRFPALRVTITRSPRCWPAWLASVK